MDDLSDASGLPASTGYQARSTPRNEGEAPAARRIYVRDKSKEFGAGPTVRTIEPKLAAKAI
jgi:hypothetical protein